MAVFWRTPHAGSNPGLELAHKQVQTHSQRQLAALVPVKSGDWRDGARLARELAPVPEGPDKHMLSDPIKNRSIKKPVIGKRSELFRGGGGHYRIATRALGET